MNSAAMVPGSDLIAREAQSLVRRSRAGDQNATATLYEIGQRARQGVARARVAFQAAMAYLDSQPPEEFALGGEPALLASSSDEGAAAGDEEERAAARQLALARVDPEAKKPPLQRGVLDRIFNPKDFALTVVRACRFRRGLPAAAAVLASGPALTAPAIDKLARDNFESAESRGCFLHGVERPGEEEWRRLAPHLEPALRRCLAIGQCVGRARKIQMVRQRGSSIGAYSETAGWELGE